MNKFRSIFFIPPILFIVFLFIPINPAFGVSVDRLFVMGSASNEVYVLFPDDLSTDTVIKLQPINNAIIAAHCDKAAYLASKNKLYILDCYSNNTIHVIDALSKKYLSSITRNDLGDVEPNDMAFSADGSRAMVACLSSLCLMDTSSDKILNSVQIRDLGSQLSGWPCGIARNPINDLYYVVLFTTGWQCRVISVKVQPDNSIKLVNTLEEKNCGYYALAYPHRDISFPPGSNRFFVSGSTEELIFSATNDAYEKSLGKEGFTSSKDTVSQDGKTIYLSTNEDLIYKMNVQKPTTLDAVPLSFIRGNSYANRATINQIAVNNDESQIYAVCSMFLADQKPSNISRVLKFNKDMWIDKKMDLPNLGEGSIVYAP